MCSEQIHPLCSSLLLSNVFHDQNFQTFSSKQETNMVPRFQWKLPSASLVNCAEYVFNSPTHGLSGNNVNKSPTFDFRLAIFVFFPLKLYFSPLSDFREEGWVVESRWRKSNHMYRGHAQCLGTDLLELISSQLILPIDINIVLIF